MKRAPPTLPRESWANGGQCMIGNFFCVHIYTYNDNLVYSKYRDVRTDINQRGIKPVRTHKMDLIRTQLSLQTGSSKTWQVAGGFPGAESSPAGIMDVCLWNSSMPVDRRGRNATW